VGEQLATRETAAAVAHTKKGKRLTDADKAFALRYHADGLTQVEIAQRLNCDQATISRWLSQCADTTVEASAYFRGRALPMAEKIVKRGRPSDLIKALQGVGVLQEERSAGLVVQIGIKDSDVQISLSPGESSARERRSAESLTIQAGSDKSRYVE
jgi:transposase